MLHLRRLQQSKDKMTFSGMFDRGEVYRKEDEVNHDSTVKEDSDNAGHGNEDSKTELINTVNQIQYLADEYQKEVRNQSWVVW